MKFLEIFEFLDLFKRPMFLYIGRKKFNATVFGVLISLAIYGFLMHSFFVSDMFGKKNPLVYDQALVAKSRPDIFFNFSSQNSELSCSSKDLRVQIVS